MYYGEPKVKNPIRWGMVGGGKGAAIGYIHRSAALRTKTLILWPERSISTPTAAVNSAPSFM